MTMRWPLLALLLAVSVAMAGTNLRQDITVQPSAGAAPATLAAGSDGTTTLGSSATSGNTSATLPGLGSAQVLLVQPGSGDWDVHMEVTSTSGFGVLDSVTVTLGGATQAQITLGTLVQDSGLPVLLDDTGSDLEVLASGSVASTGTLETVFVLVPAGGSQPSVSYPYTLTVS